MVNNTQKARAGGWVLNPKSNFGLRPLVPVWQSIVILRPKKTHILYIKVQSTKNQAITEEKKKKFFNESCTKLDAPRI